jgi:Na+/alanine symporter
MYIFDGKKFLHTQLLFTQGARCVFAVLCFFLLVLPARAESDVEPEESEKTFFETVDDAFGAYLVGPLAGLMFYDIAFWDNELPLGEIVTEPISLAFDDKSLNGKMWDVVGYDLKTKTYSVFEHRTLSVYEVVPALGGPLAQKTKIPSVAEPLIWEKMFKDGTLQLTISAQEYRDLGEIALVPWEDWEGAKARYSVDSLPVQWERLVATELIDGIPVVVDRAIEIVPEEGAPAEEDEIAPYRFPEQSVLLPSDVIPLEKDGLGYVDEGLVSILKIDSKTGNVDVRSLTKEKYKKTLPNPKDISLPAVVVWLVLGAVFFTFRMAFINLRGFAHAISVTAGKYDSEEDEGEVSHFQALSSALSATVGLGNIAGVAVAVAVGGPGAIIWMVIAGFLGMSSKFVECTLGQMYRKEDSKGDVSGGPMHYLYDGLKEKNLGGLGKALSIIFALMCIGGSLGGGNMFQSNQSFAQLSNSIPFFAPKSTGDVVFAVDREKLQSELLGAAAKEASASDLLIPSNTKIHASIEGTSIDFITTEATLIPAGEKASSSVSVRALLASEAGNVPANSISKISAFAYGALDSEKAKITPNLRVAFHQNALSVSNPQDLAGGGAPKDLLYGIMVAILVGVVILGGIKSIGKVASLIVPVMCAMYVMASLYVLIVHAADIPAAFGTMFSHAFGAEAAYGGLIGALIQGFRRAAFSNEAGVGSASIAHSAAATNEPVREGIVALLEPFIDTIVICTMTGLVVVITGVYDHPDLAGVELTSLAFGSVLSWFPILLSVAVFFFAFSTMISWSYYGERCATFLFGPSASLPYKIIFLFCVVFGAVIKLGNVLDFSDLMVLGMAFPNILGLFILSGSVRARLDDYWSRLQSGEMKRNP